MNVLVLGSGAREHALAWKLKADPSVKRLIVAPGNPGCAAVAELATVAATDPASVVALAQRERIDLVVVGPEAPLVAGVADALRAAGILVFGPSQAAARIEGSKAFAKEVMLAAGVPAARSETFQDAKAAAERARELGAVVVKADGLAGGKGVVVAESGEEAAQACEALGATPGGATLLLEEKLAGPEVSVIAVCDGARFALLPAARDHKRVGDGDTGPNTGGMGAFAPVDSLSTAELADIGVRVIAPTLRELAKRGSLFIGALYAGLMLTKDGPRVLEFNCRFGDPETQPLMMQLDEPLAQILRQCAAGALETTRLQHKSGASLGIVLASYGYPAAPRLGDEIFGLPFAAPDVEVFHGGTELKGGRLVTAGGRVLTVCARGPTLAEAKSRAYRAAERITFSGKHARSDIGGT